MTAKCLIEIIWEKFSPETEENHCKENFQKLLSIQAALEVKWGKKEATNKIHVHGCYILCEIVDSCKRYFLPLNVNISQSSSW